MLQVQDLTKVYGNVADGPAGGIRDASFALKPGAFFTLLGPSGCGKTTTLRCVAGLERPDRGRISVQDRVLFDGTAGTSVPMNRRQIGMVFQSYAIWPHMTVYQNVSFPLRVSKDRKYSRSEMESLASDALRTVGLDGYQSRSATRLSGGQQQRVALARAIVHRPQLLLLDEPLSNLDAALREEMRSELKRLQQQIGVTAVYVTHDQSEALAMSDEIAVIDHGRIVQQGSPWDVYFKPRNEFVAGFIGQTNLLRGALGQSMAPESVGEVKLNSGPIVRCFLPERASGSDAVAISVRPENIGITDCATDFPLGDLNVLAGRVESASFLGNLVRYVVQTSGSAIQVESNPDRFFQRGTEVTISFEPRHALAVPASPSAGDHLPEREVPRN